MFKAKGNSTVQRPQIQVNTGTESSEPNVQEVSHQRQPPVRSVQEVMQSHLAGIRAKDGNAIGANFAEASKVFHTDATSKRTNVYTGPKEIALFFKSFSESIGESPVRMLKSETAVNPVILEWDNLGAGIEYAFDVFNIVDGTIQLQTIVTVSINKEESTQSNGL